MAISRRMFLGGILAFVAGSVAYKSIPLHRIDNWESLGPKGALRNIALNLKGINIGVAENDYLNILEEKLLARNWDEVNSVADFNSWIRQTIKTEFVAEKTANLDGWVLSEFERDMIAYAVLIKNKEGVATTEDSGSFESAKIANFIKINDWGPKSTCVGMSFNAQSDGHSSHWFSIEPYNGRVKVYIGGKAIPTTKNTNVITTKIENTLLNDINGLPGRLDVMVYDPARNIKQKLGIFEVFGQPPRATTVDGAISTHFGKVLEWGPKSIAISQFTGAAKTALWIKTSCAPNSAEMKLGGISLKTVVGPNLVTGTYDVATSEIHAGRFSLELKDRNSGESIPLGELELFQ